MIISKRPELKKLKHIKHEIIKDELSVFKDFVDVMEDKVNLDIFYYKHVDIRFINEINHRHLGVCLAEYVPLKRTILYSEDNFKETIMHELFHVASTLVGKDTIYLGLCQIDRKTKVSYGIGLTEGVTCLLDDKYFGNYTKSKKDVVGNSYFLLKRVCSYIEMIYGSDFIEECYFNADLQTFINVLANDIGLEDVHILMCALDNMHAAHLGCLKGFFNSIKATKVLFDNFNVVLRVIEKMYYKNIYENLLNGNISKSEFDNAIGYLRELVGQQVKSTIIPYYSRRISDSEFDDIADGVKNEVLLKRKLKEM